VFVLIVSGWIGLDGLRMDGWMNSISKGTMLMYEFKDESNECFLCDNFCFVSSRIRNVEGEGMRKCDNGWSGGVTMIEGDFDN